MGSSIINFIELERKYKFSQYVIKLFSEKYGQRTENIIRALKRPCKTYSIRVNTLKTTPKEVLESLQNQGIQAALHSILEEVINLPVSGPFKIPEHDKKIVVDKFTAESLIQGADLYAPGVLKTAKIRRGDKVTIITKTGEILASGKAKMTANDMLQLRKGLAVKVVDSIYKIISIRESQLFKEGDIFDQSLPSILVSKVLDPKLNECILDMCAAPGGKATHIGQLMQNTGQILAVDRSIQRIKRIKEHIQRLGITNIRILNDDSRNLSEKYHHWADRILIDPPCSALGVRPKLFDATTEKEIINMANYQRQFLRSAVKYIKPNGIIVYSTCTLTTEENEENIKFLLDNFDCKIVEQPIFLGNPGEETEGLLNWQKLQRFYPDIDETAGYFIAKIQMLS